MIERFAKCLVDFLNRHKAIDPMQKEIYVYGADLALYTLFSTSGLLLVGLLFHRFWESVVIVVIYYINQTLGGGYHANTHSRCFLMMLVGIIICLLTFFVDYPIWVDYIISALSLCVLIKHPLVLHNNKEYLDSQKPALIIRYRAIVGVLGCIAIVVFRMGHHKYIHAWMLGMTVSMISRILAVKLKRPSMANTTINGK